MTINKAIEHGKDQLQIFGGEHKEFIELSIDIMHKYQKIAELYDYWRSGRCEYTISCMENIGKVLRDGNVD